MNTSKIRSLLLVYIVVLLVVADSSAQISAFNYQGRLNDNNVPANGSYEMQFRLYDSLAGGVTIRTAPNVTATFGS